MEKGGNALEGQNNPILFKPAEFAKIVGITKRALRYYEEIGLLKPSYKNYVGHRFYSESDFKIIQQIITLKFIGFSIDEIKKIKEESISVKNSLNIQQEALQQKLCDINLIMKAVKELQAIVENWDDINRQVDWEKFFYVIKAVKMEEYYSKRSKEYEDIYFRKDSVRQREQAEIKEDMSNIFRGRDVLEIACGTGYWTEIIVEVANTLLATDISEEMLHETVKKFTHKKAIKFQQVDAYKLNNIKQIFNAGCANFWFSHIPKSKLKHFLDGFHKKLEKKSIVFMADNMYIHGIGGELITKPFEEDTYKLRELSNGEKYEVLKNYYNEEELKDIFSEYSDNLQVKIGECFWWVCYNVK